MMLIEPTIEYDQQIQRYRREFLDCGDSMDGTGALRKMDNPKDWIEHSEFELTVPNMILPKEGTVKTLEVRE